MGEKANEMAEKEIEELVINESKIKNLIYVIRGQQVMLDSDLAMLYQVETKNINKAMKRNIDRFPEDFCFQLSKEEYTNLKFQFGTSSLEENENMHGGRRKLPYMLIEVPIWHLKQKLS